jgi:uncharacterized protein
VEIVFGAVAIFTAGMVQGCTGFGLGMVAAPSLMLLMHPATAVPTVISLSTINSFFVALDARKHFRFFLVAPLAAGGLIGLPIGVYALRILDPVILKFTVGIVIILFAAARLFGWSHPLPNRLYTVLPIGFASGFLGGSTAMGGPPLILFLTNQNTPRDIFRANLGVYFCTASIYTIAWYYLSGIYTGDVFRSFLVLAPCMLIGTFTGVFLSRHIPEEKFRNLVMIAVACMGCMLIITSARSLFF